MHCPSCGDLIGEDGLEVGGVYHCKECADEKLFGIIGPPPQSIPSLIRCPVDDNPWQSNAIRVLEG